MVNKRRKRVGWELRFNGRGGGVGVGGGGVGKSVLMFTNVIIALMRCMVFTLTVREGGSDMSRLRV